VLAGFLKWKSKGLNKTPPLGFPVEKTLLRRKRPADCSATKSFVRTYRFLKCTRPPRKTSRVIIPSPSNIWLIRLSPYSKRPGPLRKTVPDRSTGTRPSVTIASGTQKSISSRIDWKPRMMPRTTSADTRVGRGGSCACTPVSLRAPSCPLSAPSSDLSSVDLSDTSTFPSDDTRTVESRVGRRDARHTCFPPLLTEGGRGTGRTRRRHKHDDALCADSSDKDPTACILDL